MTLPRRGEDGFTLIEMVIALLVMSIAVIAIVTALAGMIRLTRDQRGHAVTETAVRSFGQAVQAQAQFSTALAGGVSAGSGSVSVTDASLIPAGGSNSYVQVDREVMRVSSVNRATNTLSVVRAQGAETSAAHAAGATLAVVLHCPTATELTPVGTSYSTTTGSAAAISGVEYWNGTSFTTQSACLDTWTLNCASSSIIEPECGLGLFRVTLQVTTPGDSRLNGLSTASQVLVRAGSV